jgi:hypothetical protein
MPIGRSLLVRVRSRTRRELMLDIILIAAGIGFFLVALLYEVACDRL